MIDFTELQQLGIELTETEMAELSHLSTSERSGIAADVAELHTSLVFPSFVPSHLTCYVVW